MRASFPPPRRQRAATADASYRQTTPPATGRATAGPKRPSCPPPHIVVEDRARALYADFSSHVPKPIEPMELFAVIAALVSGRWRQE